MEFKSRIEEIREMFNRTRVPVTEIAEETGVNYQTASAIVKGKHRHASSESVDKVYFFLKSKIDG